MTAKANTSATLEAIAECKNMTELLKADLAKYDAQKLEDQKLVAEWGRLKTIYDASKAVYDARCGGSCRAGGVQRYGCDPLCRNWSTLNSVAPIHPPAVPLPYPGTYVCSICSQAVDISGVAGGDINVLKNAINQQMTCTTTLEKQISDMAESGAAIDSNAGAPVAPTPVKPIIPISTVTTETSQEVSQPETSNTKTFIIIGAVLIILIIIGVLVAWILMSGPDEEAAEPQKIKVGAAASPHAI